MAHSEKSASSSEQFRAVPSSSRELGEQMISFIDSPIIQAATTDYHQHLSGFNYSGLKEDNQQPERR